MFGGRQLLSCSPFFLSSGSYFFRFSLPKRYQPVRFALRGTTFLWRSRRRPFRSERTFARDQSTAVCLSCYVCSKIRATGDSLSKLGHPTVVSDGQLGTKLERDINLAECRENLLLASIFFFLSLPSLLILRSETVGCLSSTAFILA